MSSASIFRDLPIVRRFSVIAPSLGISTQGRSHSSGERLEGSGLPGCNSQADERAPRLPKPKTPGVPHRFPADQSKST